MSAAAPTAAASWPKLAWLGLLPTTEVSMKSMIAIATGSVAALASGAAFAQSGNMMNGGGMWGVGWMGGYGGYWMPILLVVLVGVVIWAIVQKRK